MAKPGRAARDAGIRWERDVAHHLNTVTTRSTRPGIHDDDGDVIVPGWTVECKDYDSAKWQIRKWWIETCVKASMHATRPMLVLKRRGMPDREALVICKLRDVA